MLVAALLLLLVLVVAPSWLDRLTAARSGAGAGSPTASVAGAAQAPAKATEPPEPLQAPVSNNVVTPVRTPVGAAARPAGAVSTQKVISRTLGKNIDYILYLPGDYAASAARYPVIYLLHGRGGAMVAWEPVLALMDDMIRAGQIPPTIFVLPDAPSSRKASYFVDSLFTGNDALPPGEKVETAFTVDLIAHIDSTYRTVANRNGRAVAGFSMGGYGALRYLLAHPQLFRAAIALSPAVYYPLPPANSSTREFGAFGKGSAAFSEAVYSEKNYPALFASFEAANLPASLFIAVGDDEDANVNPADAVHDLDYEAHTLYNKARRVKNLLVELRVMDGGHDWVVWRPGFLEGLQYIYKFVKAE